MGGLPVLGRYAIFWLAHPGHHLVQVDRRIETVRYGEAWGGLI